VLCDFVICDVFGFSLQKANQGPGPGQPGNQEQGTREPGTRSKGPRAKDKLSEAYRITCRAVDVHGFRRADRRTSK
jgi:hypothetical protein